MLVAILIVEVLRYASSMVHPDEVLDRLRKVVLLRHSQSVRHMLDDDSSALRRGELIVWIDRTLIPVSYTHLDDVSGDGVESSSESDISEGADSYSACEK